MRTNKTSKIAGIALAAALALTAVGVGAAPAKSLEVPEGHPLHGVYFRITADEAKQAALADAGVAADDATFFKAELDDPYGIVVYDLEFEAGGMKYSYRVDANTREVVSSTCTDAEGATVKSYVEEVFGLAQQLDQSGDLEVGDSLD